MIVLQMGDQSVEMTEEKQDEAQIAKGKAVEAMADGKLLGSWSWPVDFVVEEPIWFFSTSGAIVLICK